jgi:hypothetical protein
MDVRMKVMLVRPDVSAPLLSVVSFFVGGVVAVGAWVSFLTGVRPICDLLPVLSASTALTAALPWNLRRARVTFGGRRLAILLVATALVSGVQAIRCRLGP